MSDSMGSNSTLHAVSGLIITVLLINFCHSSPLAATQQVLKQLVTNLHSHTA